MRAVLVFADARGERVAHGARLLVNLLHHEVLVAVLFGGGGVPLDFGDGLLDFLAVDAVDVQLIAGQAGDFHVVDIDDPARVAEHGGHIGGNHMSLHVALAAAQNQRAVLAGGVDDARLVAEKDAQRIAATHAHHHRANRVECALARGHRRAARIAVIAVKQQCGNLRIRLGLEGVALAHESGLDFLIVLDDAVVHDDHALFAGIVRMGVDGARLAVRRPARMADAAAATHGGAGIGHLHQGLEPPLRLDNLHMVAVLVAHGNARGVIAAVFEPAQSVQQNRRRLTHADISHNSAHFLSFPLFIR